MVVIPKKLLLSPVRTSVPAPLIVSEPAPLRPAEMVPDPAE